MTILDRIFETKREEVAASRRTADLGKLEAQAAEHRPRGFASTLANSPHSVSLIAEVKRASPSKGVIREDFDALEIAETYATAGADCLSVLTDIRYFQGDPGFLPKIREQVALPCLRKDFIYDSFQILESRALGADAILLIAAYLDPTLMSDLKAEIESHGIDALVEVHTDRECEIAAGMGCKLVGVNNRNLADFETKLTNSVSIIPRLRQMLPDAVLVSESAIESLEDVRVVQQSGARSVLIGTTFCAAPDIVGKVREVMGWSE